MKPSFQSQIVRDYLSKFPLSASSAIAEKLFLENPTIFKEKESARRLVRYYRGASGKKDIEYRHNDSLLSPHRPSGK